MQEIKNRPQVIEQVIFDQAQLKSLGVEENQEAIDIMDIPGTAHDKLLALSKMI